MITLQRSTQDDFVYLAGGTLSGEARKKGCHGFREVRHSFVNGINVGAVGVGGQGAAVRLYVDRYGDGTVHGVHLLRADVCPLWLDKTG